MKKYVAVLLSFIMFGITAGNVPKVRTQTTAKISTQPPPFGSITIDPDIVDDCIYVTEFSFTHHILGRFIPIKDQFMVSQYFEDLFKPPNA